MNFLKRQPIRLPTLVHTHINIYTHTHIRCYMCSCFHYFQSSLTVVWHTLLSHLINISFSLLFRKLQAHILSSKASYTTSKSISSFYFIFCNQYAVHKICERREIKKQVIIKQEIFKCNKFILNINCTNAACKNYYGSYKIKIQWSIKKGRTEKLKFY